MISPATIDAVKARAEILDLVREVTTVHRKGDSYVALCPFHGERTPSFTIHPQRNFAHCFGCRTSVDPIEFVIRNEGGTFPDAIRSLAERYGIDIEEGTQKDRDEADATRREQQDLYAMNNTAAAFYMDRLWGRESARGAVYAFEETERRGLTARPEDGSPEGAALAAFKIGYAPAAWRSLVEHLRASKLSLPLAEKAGLLGQKDGRFYDRFRHRLMFPVLDQLGRIVGFSGRSLPEPDERYMDAPNFRNGDKLAKYVNTPETPIYTKGAALFGLWQARDAIRAAGEALLVEGNFDVVSLHARGLTNAIAPLGTAFTEPQARMLRKFTTAVAIAFDGDKAGDKATYDARTHVRTARLTARAVSLPAGADPDSLVVSRGPDVLRELVARAPGLREHLYRRCFAGDASHDARAGQINAAIALLAEETDPAVRGMEKVFVDKLAAHMVVDGHAPSDLRDLEIKVRRATRGAVPTDVLGPPEDPVAFAVLGAVLDVPSIATDPATERVMAVLEGDLALGVAAAQETFASEVLAKTPESLRPHVEARLAAPLHTTPAAALGAFLANGTRLIERRSIASEAYLRLCIADAERAGDDGEVDRLLAELGEAVRRRVSR